ncbi:MAG: hypothetical protein Q8S33_19085 [Myxococcales bacterium]|nr:hypothetical protein [Myxococcales bacterium]MDP3502449.1 hypothetical protein [Myxococcales bacterium]
MIALIVAALTASSTLAALWPLMRSDLPRLDLVRRSPSPVVHAPHKARRFTTITVIRTTPKPGAVTKGCSSARKRPCVRRRLW